MGALKNNQKYTKKDFVERAKSVHGDRYGYSKVDYVNSKTKVVITCPVHGEFEQQPSNHLSGQGCPTCGRLVSSTAMLGTTERFIKKSRAKFGDKYDYSKVDYKNASTEVIIICPNHGEQFITPTNHLRTHGCAECGKEFTRNSCRSNTKDFIKKARKKHGNFYDYSKSEYVRSGEKVCIICPFHGEFWQTPDNHLYGFGCARCGDERCSTAHSSSTEEFITKAKEVHGDRYIYDLVDYRTAVKNVTIICPTHGEFEQLPNNHLRGYNCPSCVRMGHSAPEVELQDFVRSLVKTEVNDRQLIKPKELDIYIPEYNLAIELNGLFWHSSYYVAPSYHLEKTNECDEKGIQLIHMFEDEWRDKKDIVKSRLMNLLGKTPDKIYARKCEIREVETSQAMRFLDENHLQGRVGGQYKYGLYHEGELVSLMTFGKLRKNLGSDSKEGSFEMLRFCNKLFTSVVGGASRLLRHFLKEVNPVEVISYADKRWSTGNLYEQLGFIYEGDTKPNYFYVVREERKNRFNYRKSELVKQGFDKNKTEKQIMEERNIYRIYDCGTKKYRWKK